MFTYEEVKEKLKKSKVTKHQSKRITEDVIIWLAANLPKQTEVDIDVMLFIAWFNTNGGNNKSSLDVYDLFKNGYCYYFALILKDAFNRGQLCVAAPYRHIVWLDSEDITSGTAYDVNGVCTDYNGLVPISELSRGIEDYKHVPGADCYTDEVRMFELCNKFGIRA